MSANLLGPSAARSARRHLEQMGRFLPRLGQTAGRSGMKLLDEIVRANDLAHVTPLDPCANALEFTKRYALKMDGRLFQADLYPHLIDPYSNPSPSQVHMAGAQTGKTRLLMTLLLWFGVLRWGQRVGFYYPTTPTAEDMSKNKFGPLLRSSRELAAYVGIDMPDLLGETSVGTVSLGPTKFTFMSIDGKDSTEGKTLAGVVFDELRLMDKGNVGRAMERQSSFSMATTGFDPMLVRASTAKYPRQDIHAAFLEGTQHYFHTVCKCPDGVVLARAFPECIVDLTHATPDLKRRAEHACTVAGVPYCGVDDRERHQYGEGMLMCPRCGTFIVNPRIGWWEADNPDAWVQSYQHPQMLSPSFSGPRLAKKFHRPGGYAEEGGSGPLDVQESYNSVAGVPYLSRDAVPIDDDVLDGCINPRLLWAANKSQGWRRRWITRTVMGVDHMDGYNCVVIKQRAPNGKYRTVHLEVCHAENSDNGDPWDRCAWLMVEYDVSACLLEAGPNLNESRRFAARFPGRVHIVTYANSHDAKIVRWPDKPSDQKGEELVQRGTVIVNRGQGLHWSIDLWRRREQECPPPNGLIQRLKRRAGKVVFTARLVDGEWEPSAICTEALFHHLKHSAFEKAYKNEYARTLGAFHYEFSGIEGIDPHFTFASMFADIALDRFGRVAPQGDYTAPWEDGGGA